MGLLGKFLLYSAATYIIDGVLRPASVAAQARLAAQARGKPLLNVGAGTAGASMRVRLLGPTDWGDSNCDLDIDNRSPVRSTPIVHCDLHGLPYHDKEFGAVVATHVLEHVDDPQKALAELHRVADEVFIVVPRWWAVHTWVHPGHQWYIRDEQEIRSGSMMPLWRAERS